MASVGQPAHARERWGDRALSLEGVSLLGQLPPLACADGGFFVVCGVGKMIYFDNTHKEIRLTALSSKAG